MKLSYSLVSAAVLTALAGCAVDGGKELDIKEEKPYVTGSNLPQRDRSNTGVVVVKPEEFDKSRSSGTAASAPKTGG